MRARSHTREPSFRHGQAPFVTRASCGIFENGKAEGKAEVLLVLLRQRGFAMSDSFEQRIRTTPSTETLDRWLGRVLEAKTIDDVFSD